MISKKLHLDNPLFIGYEYVHANIQQAGSYFSLCSYYEITLIRWYKSAWILHFKYESAFGIFAYKLRNRRAMDYPNIIFCISSDDISFIFS